MASINRIESFDGHYDFVRFTWSDIQGISRSVSIPKSALNECLSDGIFVISGYVALGPKSELLDVEEFHKRGNSLLMPDIKSLHPLPWAADQAYRVGEVYCDIYEGEEPSSNAPRHLAKIQFDRLRDLGYIMKSSIELEFFLCKDGKPITKASDAASFNLNLIEKLLYDIVTNLEQMKIPVEAVHVENGPGMLEVKIKPQVGLHAIDMLYLAKDAIKQFCQSKGYEASFMTFPNFGFDFLSAHFNHSIWKPEEGKDTRNAFFDSNCTETGSEMMKNWTAGLLKHGMALTALCCPTVNCYRRMHQEWQPHDISWGYDARIALFRLKALGESGTYIENRLPSSASNPYIVAAATIAAGLDGVMNKLHLPAELDSKAERVPSTLNEALDHLNEDATLTLTLGKTFVTWFTRLKRDFEISPLSDSDVSKTREGHDPMTGKRLDYGIGKERELYYHLM